MTRRLGPAFVLTLAAALPAPAGETVDLSMITRIRQEGFERSRVMETLSDLCDVIGPRLTGSPQMKKASEWARARLESWGLASAHLEPWGPFGRGWTLEHASVHLVSPDVAPLIAVPRAWTPGTHGPVRGKVLRARIESEADFAAYKGKLAGAIVFLADPREVKLADKPLASRYSEKDLEGLARFEVPPLRRPAEREAWVKRYGFQRALARFLAEEKAVAAVEPSPRGDGGTVFVAWGGSWKSADAAGVPALVMAVEHYNRLARLVERGLEVELEVDVRVRADERDQMADNTVAEIPGTDGRGEVVMAGAHLDSWHAGTGATDNGAGVAVVMEAARILRALEARPRRTIRIALWSGEEQGDLGSKAYVAQHFAWRPEPSDPEQRALPEILRKATWPLTLRPEHAKLSAYFNLDAGTGRIRGIHAQGNAAAAPIFEAWLKPLADLGAATVTLRNDGDTDNEVFDAAGLPAFNFIQDEVEYETRTHHTNMDVVDRVQREDLMQAAVVVASFLYDAATRDGLIPRKPLPKGE